MKPIIQLFCLFGSLAALFQSSAAAQELPAAAAFRDTPPAAQIFSNQWSEWPSVPSRFDLELLRNADRETVRLGLKDAILTGLKNNPGIEVERLEPALAVERTFGEKAIFDPTLNFEFKKNYSIDAYGTAASPFFQPAQTNRNQDWNLSLKKLFITGTQFEMFFLNNRFVGSLPNQVLKPQYMPRLGFSLNQPLLRDFGWGLTTIFVRISENREGISLLGYRAKLAQLVQRITEVYWGAVFAVGNLRVQEKGIELADALLRDAEAKVRVGLFPATSVTEARAERARREEQLIAAQNTLEVSRSNLKLVLNLNPNQTFLPRNVEPTDTPSVEPLIIDRQKSFEQAMTQRAEIQSGALNLRNRELQLRFAENQLLPRLDLRAGVGLTGIAGDLKPGAVNPFPGGYGSSLGRLGSGNFYNYSVGIILQVPLGNGQARSRYSQARIELAQERARQRELVNQVALEVERASADVGGNFKRVQSARRAKQLAEENLRSQEKRFQVGLITQKDVIDFQAKFLEAEGTELRAITDYNNSLARLKLAEGTLLESYNVKIEGGKKEADPWWAKF